MKARPILLAVLFIALLCIPSTTVRQAESKSPLANPPQCPNSLFVIPSHGVLGWPYKDPDGGEPGYSNVHTGIDIHGATEDEVYAAYDGTVRRIGTSSIRIWHPELGIDTYYSHLSVISVKGGDEVERGDPIGKKGDVGSPGVVQLHFSVSKPNQDERYLQNTFDPSPYLGATVNYENGTRAFQGTVLDWCVPRGVTLFDLPNYDPNGNSLRIEGRGPQNLPSWLNERVSSIDIYGDWIVKLYKHADLGEPSRTFTANDPDFSNDTFDNGDPLDNEVSSLKVDRLPPI